MRIHSGERPYTCPYPNCGRTFTESGNLNTHKRLHEDDKPLKRKKITPKIRKPKFKAISAFVPYRPKSVSAKVQKLTSQVNSPPLHFESNNNGKIEGISKDYNSKEIGEDIGNRISTNSQYLPSYNSYGMITENPMNHPIFNVRELPIIQNEVKEGLPLFVENSNGWKISDDFVWMRWLLNVN